MSKISTFTKVFLLYKHVAFNGVLYIIYPRKKSSSDSLKWRLAAVGLTTDISTVRDPTVYLQTAAVSLSGSDELKSVTEAQRVCVYVFCEVEIECL
jgi:hypothetical protein